MKLKKKAKKLLKKQYKSTNFFKSSGLTFKQFYNSHLGLSQVAVPVIINLLIKKENEDNKLS